MLVREFSDKCCNLEMALMDFEFLRKNETKKLLREIKEKDELI